MRSRTPETSTEPVSASGSGARSPVAIAGEGTRSEVNTERSTWTVSCTTRGVGPETVVAIAVERSLACEDEQDCEPAGRFRNIVRPEELVRLFREAPNGLVPTHVDRGERGLPPEPEVAVFGPDREALPLAQEREVGRLLQLGNEDALADCMWYAGGHVGFFWAGQVSRFVEEALAASGLVATERAVPPSLSSAEVAAGQ